MVLGLGFRDESNKLLSSSHDLAFEKTYLLEGQSRSAQHLANHALPLLCPSRQI